MRISRLLSLLCPVAVAAGILSAPPAFAQDAAAAATMPADVVKLKNGSMYRGTIMELVAGDHVDLRLASGEVKHFQMVDVKYAGAASEQPAEAPKRAAQAEDESEEHPAERRVKPRVTVNADEAQVHFVGNTDDVDFHMRTYDATVSGGGWGAGGAFTYSGGAHGYDRICTAPCDATLPVGKHRLALSIKKRPPIEVDDAIEIAGPSTVHGTYDDNRGTRIAGWTIFGLGVGAGLVIMLVGMTKSGQDCSEQSITGSCITTVQPDTGMIAGGLVVMGASTLLGLILALKHDSVTIEVTPMDTAMRWPLRVAREGAWLAPASGQGMGLRLRF